MLSPGSEWFIGICMADLPSDRALPYIHLLHCQAIENYCMFTPVSGGRQARKNELNGFFFAGSADEEREIATMR